MYFHAAQPAPMRSKALPIIRLLCMTLLLPASCAIYTPAPLGIQGRKQLAIAVAPSTISAPVHRLSDIRNINKDKVGIALLQRDLAAIRKGTDASVDGWLGKRKGVHRIDGADIDGTDAGHPGKALAWAKRKRADLLLAVDISGYGQVKRRWVALLFGSGVAEGVTQGMVVTSATGNPALGLGVGAEEIASEGLTWVGGSWFWGKYFAPVTLEGRLWRVRDGRLIWHDVRFADNSDEIWKLLTGKPLPTKGKALAASLGRAEKGLFADLGRYIHQQILPNR